MILKRQTSFLVKLTTLMSALSAVQQHLILRKSDDGDIIIMRHTHGLFETLSVQINK